MTPAFFVVFISGSQRNTGPDDVTGRRDRKWIDRGEMMRPRN